MDWLVHRLDHTHVHAVEDAPVGATKATSTGDGRIYVDASPKNDASVGNGNCDNEEEEEDEVRDSDDVKVGMDDNSVGVGFDVDDADDKSIQVRMS